ncbi:MAG: NAD-dependent epimerase/dehydratase family protein [Deltaproteobacteria bacterium]|nr:NAD-dependent epimerase/dehydratase family protein [Deltaproteobacteria bacterium]
MRQLDPSANRDTVLVTGAAGRFSRLVVQMLHRRYEVVAVDKRPMSGLPKDVTHHRTDLRLRLVDELFRKHAFRAVVHLGIAHNPRSDDEAYRFNVVGTRRLLDLVSKHKVSKLVALTSANIYGPHPDNSHFLTEEAPLLGADSFADIRDLVSIDQLVTSFLYREPAVETVLLRPVHIVGPRVKNAPSNFLRLQRPLVLAGFDPMVQFVHEEDVARAISKALAPGVRGVFNLTGPGVAPLSRVLALLGRKPVSLPGPVFRWGLGQAFRARITSFPAPELRHIQFNCVVDGSLARRVLGFEPEWSMVETIRSVLDRTAQ